MEKKELVSAIKEIMREIMDPASKKPSLKGEEKQLTKTLQALANSVVTEKSDGKKLTPETLAILKVLTPGLPCLAEPEEDIITDEIVKPKEEKKVGKKKAAKETVSTAVKANKKGKAEKPKAESKGKVTNPFGGRGITKAAKEIFSEMVSAGKYTEKEIVAETMRRLPDAKPSTIKTQFYALKKNYPGYKPLPEGKLFSNDDGIFTFEKTKPRTKTH